MDLDIKYEGIIKNQQNIINYLTKEVKRLKRELKESKKLEWYILIIIINP